MNHYYPPSYGAYPAPVVAQPMRPCSQAHMVVAWIFAVLTALYLLPWAIAATRNHTNVLPIALLNFFFGWTFIGWVGTLIWACVGTHTHIVAVNPNPMLGPGRMYPSAQPYGNAPGNRAPYGAPGYGAANYGGGYASPGAEPSYLTSPRDGRDAPRALEPGPSQAYPDAGDDGARAARMRFLNSARDTTAASGGAPHWSRDDLYDR